MPRRDSSTFSGTFLPGRNPGTLTDADRRVTAWSSADVTSLASMVMESLTLVSSIFSTALVTTLMSSACGNGRG